MNRPPTMEQDEKVVALAKKIYTGWMKDARWRAAHLHHPNASVDHPIAFFWAEIAARVALTAAKLTGD